MAKSSPPSPPALSQPKHMRAYTVRSKYIVHIRQARKKVIVPVAHNPTLARHGLAGPPLCGLWPGPRSLCGNSRACTYGVAAREHHARRFFNAALPLSLPPPPPTLLLLLLPVGIIHGEGPRWRKGDKEGPPDRKREESPGEVSGGKGGSNIPPFPPLHSSPAIALFHA